MTPLLLAWILGIGVWVFADGIASLWAYMPDKKQTWKRDHTLRAVRCGIGIALMVIASIALGGDVKE